MKIGVVAVQGAFIEHIKMFEKLGVECVQLRNKKDLEQSFDGIVLSGGESTVQGKLLKELDMFDYLKKMIESGVPTMATCAGMILLAEKISNDEKRYFSLMPITVRRNAYGRQLGSFEAVDNIKNIGDYPCVYIRAPYVTSVSKECEVLCEHAGKITAVRYKNMTALSFHPELTEDLRVHKAFLEKI